MWAGDVHSIPGPGHRGPMTEVRTHEPILDAHPHAWAPGGIVLLEVAIWSEETGEEETHPQSIPCRRCAEAREEA